MQPQLRSPELYERYRKAVWEQSEDMLILESVIRFGTQWGRVAELLPGRSEDAVRNRYVRELALVFLWHLEGKREVAISTLLPLHLLDMPE